MPVIAIYLIIAGLILFVVIMVTLFTTFKKLNNESLSIAT